MSINYEGDFDFSALREDLNAALVDALQEAGDFIADRTDPKVPVLEGEALKKANQERRAEPGELVRSRYVRVEGNSQVAVGYSMFIAGWQHERLDYHHEHGQAKFLEDTINADGEEAYDKLADRLSESV